MTEVIADKAIVAEVQHAFKVSFSPLVETGEMRKEQANEYFKAFFESQELVTVAREGLSRENEKVDFVGVSYSKEPIQTGSSNGGMIETKAVSYYDNFIVFLKEEYEPRDVAYYCTIIFHPTDLVSHVL